MKIYKVYKLYNCCGTYGGYFGDKYFFNIKNVYELLTVMLSVNIVLKFDIIETEDEIDG